MLTAPFMRAALVIEIEAGWAAFPGTKPAWFFGNGTGRRSRTLLPGEESLTWVVPTRHPQRLRVAIEAATGRPAPAQDREPR